MYRWAIRQGDWKLVKNGREPLSLYNLADDVGETNNLATKHPERVDAMHAAWKQWDASNQEPRWGKNRGAMPRVHHARVNVLDKEIRLHCIGNDPQKYPRYKFTAQELRRQRK